MISTDTLKRGCTKGISTAWELSKVIVPIYIFVTILGQTPVMSWLAGAAQPIMSILGLPGKAAMALVLGNFLNIYAAIGAIVALKLSSSEITVIALVLLISHSLLVETAVSKKTGIEVRFLVLVRVLGAFVSGALLNWLMKGMQ